MSSPGKATIELFDNNGRYLETVLHDRLSPAYHQQRIILDSYPTGVYYIRFSNGLTSAMQKAVLVR
jgi:hypothetical protein